MLSSDNSNQVDADTGAGSTIESIGVKVGKAENKMTSSGVQEVFNNLMIAENILGYIKRGDQKRFRLVNQNWNDAFLSNPRFYENGITLDGEKYNDRPFALKELVAMLSNQKKNKKVYWTTLNVFNLNMDSQLILNDFLHFKMLIDRLFSHVTSLGLYQVKLTAERFVELVVICGNLEKIQITNAPSIFKAGFNMRENEHIDYFRERMSNLKQLKVSQSDEPLGDDTEILVISNDILTTMADSMTKLEIFELFLSEDQIDATRKDFQFLLEKTIGKIMFNNRSTLWKLALGGKFNLDHPLLICLARSNMTLSLEHLYLSKCDVKSEEFLMNFLLNLNHTTLKHLTLMKFPIINDNILGALKNFVNLKVVILCEASVSKNTLNCLIDFKFFGDLPKLRIISLRGCNQIILTHEEHKFLTMACQNIYDLRIVVDKEREIRCLSTPRVRSFGNYGNEKNGQSSADDDSKKFVLEFNGQSYFS